MFPRYGLFVRALEADKMEVVSLARELSFPSLIDNSQSCGSVHASSV